VPISGVCPLGPQSLSGPGRPEVQPPAQSAPIGSYFDPTNTGKPACFQPPTFPTLPNCNPIGFLGDLACFLAGSTTPFDQTTLDALYSSNADYVDQVTVDADRLRDEGFLLNRDRKEIIDRAEASDIP